METNSAAHIPEPEPAHSSPADTARIQAVVAAAARRSSLTEEQQKSCRKEPLEGAAAADRRYPAETGRLERSRTIEKSKIPLKKPLF